ncbi:hypothetical protein HDU96_001213 [Phlyctochytrium bullatum]|nr:hypothetical protein HDU96_001213 [Phlyctochytrium bullatum]
METMSPPPSKSPSQPSYRGNAFEQELRRSVYKVRENYINLEANRQQQDADTPDTASSIFQRNLATVIDICRRKAINEERTSALIDQAFPELSLDPGATSWEEIISALLTLNDVDPTMHSRGAKRLGDDLRPQKESVRPRTNDDDNWADQEEMDVEAKDIHLEDAEEGEGNGMKPMATSGIRNMIAQAAGMEPNAIVYVRRAGRNVKLCLASPEAAAKVRHWFIKDDVGPAPSQSDTYSPFDGEDSKTQETIAKSLAREAAQAREMAVIVKLYLQTPAPLREAFRRELDDRTSRGPSGGGQGAMSTPAQDVAGSSGGARPLCRATANVQGLREKTRFVNDLIRMKNLDFVAVQETLSDPVDNLRDDHLRATVLEARKTKGQGGLAIIRNTNTTVVEDLVFVAGVEENGHYLWFLFRSTLALSSINQYANPLQHRRPVAILGDLNCRLGRISNDNEISHSQRRWALIDATAGAGLWTLTSRPKAEPWTYVTKQATAQVGTSVIDLIAISQDLQPRKKYVTVVKDAGLPSPHFPVMIEIQVPDLPLTPPPKLGTVFKTERLKSKTVLRHYLAEAEAHRDAVADAIQEALSPITEAQEEEVDIPITRGQEAVEAAYSLITATVHTLATDVLDGQPLRDLYVQHMPQSVHVLRFEQPQLIHLKQLVHYLLQHKLCK